MLEQKYNIIVGTISEVMELSPRTGRPPIENPRNIRFTARLTEEEATDLQECADALKVSRTDVIVKGIELVKSEISKQK